MQSQRFVHKRVQKGKVLQCFPVPWILDIMRTKLSENLILVDGRFCQMCESVGEQARCRVRPCNETRNGVAVEKITLDMQSLSATGRRNEPANDLEKGE